MEQRLRSMFFIALQAAMATNSSAATTKSIEQLAIYQLCSKSEPDCNAKMKLAGSASQEAFVKITPLFQTKQAIQWESCTRFKEPAICLTFDEQDILAWNTLYGFGAHRNLALVVRGKVISEISVRGAMENPLPVVPAADGIGIAELANFLDRRK